MNCYRYEVSDRGAAGIATALMRDLGLVTEGDKDSVIDRNKIAR